MDNVNNKLKIILDTKKIEDTLGKAKELQKKEHTSLISQISMIDDAKIGNWKIYQVNINNPKKHIPSFILL